MRIGVVSDTHGHMGHALQAVRMLESLEVDQVLHCGDIGSPEIVPLFEPWPSHFVFGNVDYDRLSLREAIGAAGQTCHERFGSLELAGIRIALLHGDDAAQLDEALSSGQWQLVCCGHTHVAEQRRQGATLLVNPGALYRANPHTLAIVELPELTVHHVRLD